MSEILDVKLLAKKVLLHMHGHFLAKMAVHREVGKHKILIFSSGQVTAIFRTIDFGHLYHPKRPLGVSF